ncbi:MAG: polysaccharide biosynthesis/export family protein [Acidobacteriota bacterium]|nr:polysaccharide biosynthesis/export family protein [Acidobacteriota bacterium]
MQRKVFLALFSASIISLPLAAQETTRATASAAAADMNPGSNLPLQRVGPEDLLNVQVYDSPELTHTVRISAEGTIRMPMLSQPIRVQGLMPSDIELLIQDALVRDKLLVSPYVVVNIVEYHSRPISVSGAVRTPTIFQAIGSVSLLDALARAGGLAPDQAGGEIIVTKPNGDTGTQSVQRIPVKALFAAMDPTLNLKLTGGEEIRVPDVGKFIVAGSVTSPGPYPILDGNQNTVVTAIAQAKGTVQYYSHRAFIYRPDDKGTLHEIPVDLGGILGRKKPDVTLYAHDILYVPDSSGRRITQTTINSLTGVGASAATAMVYVLK